MSKCEPHCAKFKKISKNAISDKFVIIVERLPNC